MQSVWAGKVEGLVELHRPLLSIACREIANQKRRLGGTFAVAHAVSSRENRDYCRQGLDFLYDSNQLKKRSQFIVGKP